MSNASLSLQIFVHVFSYSNRFEAYIFVSGLWPPAASYEQTNIFLLSCAASIIAAIVFSKGAPYRKPLYTNGNYKLLLLC